MLQWGISQQRPQNDGKKGTVISFSKEYLQGNEIWAETIKKEGLSQISEGKSLGQRHAKTVTNGAGILSSCESEQETHESGSLEEFHSRLWRPPKKTFNLNTFNVLSWKIR